MLLARKGHRVLLLDRDRFPSDMGQSTHLIHPLGVAHLRAWGTLPRIAARATPFTEWRVDLHGTVLQGTPPAVDGHNVSHGPRRLLLDGVLAEAAVAAGAEFRDGVRVVDLVEDGGRVAGVVIAGEGGARHVEHARLVIGADGPGSVVARTAGAVDSLVERVVQSNIWSYWQGIALDHVRLYIRERAGAFAFPSSDGTVLVAANLMHDEFLAARRAREAAFHARVEEVAPDLHALLPGAERVEGFHAGCTRAFVRAAAGPGWALVGDAGMKKDPVTAQGISTAFRCAEMLAEAAADGLSGRQPLDDGTCRLPRGARRLAAALLPLHRPARPLRQADRDAGGVLPRDPGRPGRNRPPLRRRRPHPLARHGAATGLAQTSHYGHGLRHVPRAARPRAQEHDAGGAQIFNVGFGGI